MGSIYSNYIKTDCMYNLVFLNKLCHFYWWSSKVSMVGPPSLGVGIYQVTYYLSLVHHFPLRVLSESWMMKSGHFSLISPMGKLVLLHFFPPINPPPFLHTLLPILPESRLPLRLPLILAGLCVTRVPHPPHLVSLQLDQLDPNLTPQDMLLISRYTLSEIARGFVYFSQPLCWCLAFLFGAWFSRESAEQEHSEQDL